MKLTLRQLQVFAEVARHDSVSRAAESLALSQSATSTALAELEQSVNQLLQSAANTIPRAAALGRQLLPRAVGLLDQTREIEQLLSGGHGFVSLQVGATLTVGNYLATLLIGHFMQRHPECKVGLQVHNTATIVEQVARYELDLGLVEGECHHPELHVEPWVADELVVFCAPGHRLAGAGRATLAELADEAWIMRESGSGTRETLDRALAAQRLRPRVRLELEHTEAIKRAVESGLGIGCISRLALRDAFRRGSLVPVETPELDLTRQFYFIWHRQKYQTAAMREFLELCREMTAGIRRSDEIILPSIA